jgi:bifunctional oligoribonuclease and PAP phosphatase NrnA
MNPNSQILTRELSAALVQQAMNLIAPAQRIVLLAHEHPDGDCLGSALGMAHILQALGKTCVPACADEPPASFRPGSWA